MDNTYSKTLIIPCHLQALINLSNFALCNSCRKGGGGGGGERGVGVKRVGGGWGGGKREVLVKRGGDNFKKGG